tara:strand:- start:47 stop:241 length:195 start_codon:yes stop_codon:yes gene_type:complete
MLITDTNVLDDPINSEEENELRNREDFEGNIDEIRDPTDIALEAWSIDLQKEWSFYNFMLHGQM